jgi:hypothetical protein
MTPRDIGLFLMSARTDATIAWLRATDGARAAFEAVYARWNDPWAAASPRYRYQRRKYEQVVSVLVNRYFFAADPDSRISRRIHLVFAQSPRLRLEK